MKGEPHGERQADFEKQRQIGSQGHEVAVGKVGEVEDTVDQGQTDSPKGQNAARDETVDDELEHSKGTLVSLMATQEHGANFRVREQRLAGVLVAILPHGQDIPTVGTLQRLARVLLDDEHGDTRAD